MAKTQTIIAAVAVVISILVPLFLNESVYSDTDLNVRLDVNTYSSVADAPSDCRFTRATDVSKTTLGKDNFSVEDDIARELLYGGFSARGATISGLVLALFAFILAVVGLKLDLNMDAAKYEGGSWFHEGDTQTFVSGILFKLLLVGSALSMVISTLLTVGALVQQGYVPSPGLDMGVDDFNPRKLPDECDGLDDNVIRRSDNLKGAIFTSALSMFALAFMFYAVLYDDKASRNHIPI